MATMPTLQQEWDESQAQTPQQEWESATPALMSAPLPGSIDSKRLSQALVHSETLGISPSIAYDQNDELENEMKRVIRDRG